jgi:hypothetical protein
VSPSESPRVAVFVAPDEILCRPMGGAGKPGDSFRATIAGAAEMQAALTDYLSAGTRRGARLHVLLSQALANFTVAPWSDALLEPRQAEIYLRGAFEAVLGEQAGRLRVASEDRGYREPRIACGVDAAWIEAVERAAAAKQARIEWLGPWFERAWRRHRSRLERGEAWCVAVERSGYAVASVRQGRVVDITFQPGDTATAGIARQLQRLSLREGLEAELPVWMIEPGAARSDLPAGWKALPWRSVHLTDWGDRVAELAA